MYICLVQLCVGTALDVVIIIACLCRVVTDQALSLVLILLWTQVCFLCFCFATLTTAISYIHAQMQ